MPVAVVRLANYVQARMPDVDCHVIEASVVFGQPVSIDGERKVFADLFDYLDRLVGSNPLFGLSTFANRDVVHALPIAQEIKRRYNAPILLGGYAASTCAQLVAQEYADLFDGICVGAGEETITAALQRLDGPNISNRDEIPNLVFMDQDTLHENPRTPAPALASFPPLDLSVLHAAHVYEQLPYFGTAGCPFKCDFCYEPWMYPGYDKNHVDKIVRDLNHAMSVMETPLVSFVDPLFGGDKKQTIPLLDAMRGSDIRFTFYTRVDVLDRETFAALGDNCNLMFVGLEAVTEGALVYMNKTHNVEQYMAKMDETMKLAFEFGVTPQIGLIPNYPLNRRADVDQIFGYLDHLRTLPDEMDEQGPGFFTTPFGYHIWPGLPHYRDLNMLESMGMTHAPAFDAEHHGIPVDLRLRRDVMNASKSYTHDDFISDKFKLYGRAHKTPLAHQNLGNYNLGFMNARMKQIVRLDGKPLRWVDESQQVLDVSAMYVERLMGRPSQIAAPAFT